jgi:NAD(P)-dependent dehydrogenase (short-subunit alcohol dehydrogenase family)
MFCRPEGIEVQIATNVLGYVWMTQALQSLLAAGAPGSRVVNVASLYAGGEIGVSLFFFFFL